MKKLFVAVFLFLTTTLCASEALDFALRLPEAARLYEKVCAEGPVDIIYAPFHSNSNAMWRSDTRTIILNSTKQRTMGCWISSVVFELHNALATKQFDYLDDLALQRKISKSGYIEAVERLEHYNALQTCKLLEKGIRQGIYPQDTRWPIHPDFDVHFQVQKQVGHSAHIAETYDHLMYYG